MSSPAWVTSRLVPQSTFSKVVYDVFFKRASSYMATVMVTATTVGIGYDYFMTFIWEKNNKGVRSSAPLPLALRSSVSPPLGGPPPGPSMRAP
tara:strand:- start:1492 stop:1770 length:279 start_codon:yes stop_codon:yes gene_type:complete